jgi:hypothetical protein
MKILLRFGQIGDLITAIASSKALGLPLYYTPNYLTFLFPLLYQMQYRDGVQMGNLLSQKLGHSVNEINLNLLRRFRADMGITDVLLLVQSPTRWSAMLVFALRIFVRIRVSVLYDGAQWFYSALRRNNLMVRKHFSELPKDSSLNVCINWDGKEEEKNLSLTTMREVVNVIRNRFVDARITITGKKRCELQIDGVGNISGEITLAKALSLIDSADLLVTCDTGPLHYAATRGVWTIAFVAARYPMAIWYPFSDHVAVISDLMIDCRQQNCSQCTSAQNFCVNGAGPLREFCEFFNDEDIQSYLSQNSGPVFPIKQR